MRRFALLIAIACAATPAAADEADQYLSWNVVLQDATPAINEFINEKIHDTLERANADRIRWYDCESLTQEIFASIYLDRLRAELTRYLEVSEDVDVCPPRDFSLAQVKNMSIYRNTSFPNMIRVTRTIRIGDVYMGIDKMAHLFGFGRRYHVKYLDHLKVGRSPAEAIEKTIQWGVFTENTVLGTGVNGIFSLADLEANYQGLLMARDFCEGDKPYLRKDGARWVLTRPLDIQDYVNPAFDESFNPSVYTDDLNDAVLPVLANTYAGKKNAPRLAERFQRYRREIRDSRSMQVVRRYFEDEGYDFQRERKLSALSMEPDDPAAPFDPRGIGGASR